ncbi:MAG: aminotransferase class III-fold pyridoxal phosphate-dependent enzyme [Bryobacterales bacterium]|nr:aminotransferase class III-fold pyridoxal phosphate-dependent enzyme [Bryobacterales bacterium]
MATTHVPATRTPLSESPILKAYAEKTRGSARLAARAQTVFPDGVTHFARFLQPHAIYVAHASGPRKWDVDGNEYVDYVGGHGALILGHSYPSVVNAVTEQIGRGTHYGASHALEVQWGELIQEMVPSAERVRFLSSGTEATHMALRLARAYTGKPAVVRFSGHFHGWHDHVAFPSGGAAGILTGIAEQSLVCAPDLEKLAQLLASRDDIAAVILEPTGATFGQAPLNGDFLRHLREMTAKHNAILIFDEVVTGFRVAPGGAQQHYGVKPDMTTLAKILAGGYPGAAVAGRADILELLNFRGDQDKPQPPAVPHQGTFNASPVSAAAGVATLNALRDGAIIDRANRTAAAIRDGMNAALQRRGLGWRVYGEFSGFHLFVNREGDGAGVEDIYAGRVSAARLKGGTPMELIHKIRCGFLLHGVDVTGFPGGLVSGVHTGADVDRTLAAFERVLGMLGEEGEL